MITPRAVTIVRPHFAAVAFVLCVGAACAPMKPEPSDPAEDTAAQDTTSDSGAAETPSGGDASDGDDSGQKEPAATATAETAQNEVQKPTEQRQRGLSGENLYRLLVADLAGRQGNLGVALEGYLQAARETKDPRVAERATRLSFYTQRFDAALAAAQRWVELAPDNADAHRALARLHLRQGDTDTAVTELERVVQLAGGGRDAWASVADILTGGESASAALTTAAELARRNRDNATVHFIEARLAANAGDDGRAMSAVERAVSLRQPYPDAIVLRARLLDRQGRSEKALRALAEAFEQYPDNRDIALGYARFLAQLERAERASRVMEQVHERFGSDAEVVYTLGLLSMQLQHWQDARLYLERLLQMEAKTDDAHYYLGRIAQQNGDCEAALQHYVKVREGERRFDAQLRAAVCMANLDRLDEARVHLERLRARHDSEDALTQIAATRGEIERLAGNPRRALEVLNRAVENHPKNSDLRYSRALAAAEVGRFELARDDLERMLERNGEDARALNALGYMLANRNMELERARSLIERALKQNPDDPATLDSMGWVLYRLGQSDKALEYLRRAWSGRKDPEIAAHLGEVLWVMGKRDEARNIWSAGQEQEPDNDVLRQTIERLTQ